MPDPFAKTAPGSALPFWLSLGVLPLAAVGATFGGWTVFLVPIYGWTIISILDAALGLNQSNANPETPEAELFWHRLIVTIWLPLQVVTIYAMIWWVTHGSALALWEKLALFCGVGVISGSVGIVYAHELMHQKSRFERWAKTEVTRNVHPKTFPEKNQRQRRQHKNCQAQCQPNRKKFFTPPRTQSRSPISSIDRTNDRFHSG